MIDLPDDELLHLYCDILVQLRLRGILRTKNLVGDYAEWLVAKRLGLTLCPNSNAGYDATDTQGVKYQIKGRQLTSTNASKQLSDIHKLDSKNFDYLIAVIFDERFSILYAGQIPYQIVFERSKYKGLNNSHILSFPRSLLKLDGVIDLTSRLTTV